MAYLVKITARAERDLVLIFAAIDGESSEAALEWYRGLRDAILSLSEQPNRCPQTPEDARLRHLLYGGRPHVYRVIYRVNERQKRVEVLHIRHGARKRFRRAEIQDP